MAEYIYRIAAFMLLSHMSFQQQRLTDILDPSKQQTDQNIHHVRAFRNANGFNCPDHPHHHHDNGIHRYTHPFWGGGQNGGSSGGAPHYAAFPAGDHGRGFPPGYVPPKPFKPNNFNISLVSVLQDRNNTKRKSENYDSSMVYPTETPFYKPINPEAPSRNCSFGLCDNVEGYPAEKIEKLISKSKELQQYFLNMNKPSFDIHTRFGEDGETFCPTMVYTKFPETAVNTDKVEKYLVNVKDYKQGIMYETCETNGGPCKFSEIFPVGYVATCKQKFTVRRLMTVSKESSEAVFDNFELPSCCVCTYKKV